MTGQPSTTNVRTYIRVKSRASLRHWKSRMMAVVEFGKEIANTFLRVDALGLSKQVAFSVIFALLPTVFVLVSVAALVEQYLDIPVTNELRTFIIRETPYEARQLLLSGVDKAIAGISTKVASLSAAVAFLLAIWGAMGGVGTLIEATNRAYGVRNTRPQLRKRLITLATTLLFTGMVVLTVVASFFSRAVVDKFSDWLGPSHWLTRFGASVQFVMSLSIALFVFFLLYHFAPDIEHSAKWSVPGAIFGTVCWVALLRLFGVVATRVPYQNIYGAASAILISLYFLNLAGVTLILGAIINGVLGEHYDQKRKYHLLAHPEKIRYVHSNQEKTVDTFRHHSLTR